MSVLVVGSVAYDSIITPTAQADDVLGGSATFFATAASHFSPVQLVAVVGDDFRHEEIAYLRERNVSLDGLQTVPGKTFRWKGRYLENMNDRETIYTHLNVFETFSPVLPEAYRQSPFVFLANIGPELQFNVMQQVQKPVFVAMDTMNFWISGAPDALRKILRLVDGLIINDAEVKELSGESNIFDGAKKIQAMGPSTLIVKKGEHGAMLVHGDSYFYCPAYPVTNLYDPTGAGDTFAGGFMGYLAKAGKVTDDNLRRAMVYGSALASFIVEGFGMAPTKNLTAADIEKRVQTLVEMVRIPS
jgi:sugar/nucleoside kinase (ribokinase family)